jgi:Zn-dependent protease
MFGRRITLFKLLGFEVRLDASWIIIAVLVTWSLAMGVFPYTYRGLPRSEYWWMGIAGALGLFGSIIIHEFSHSLVARRYGLRMRGITLFIFGGVAEMEDEPSSAKTEFLMAIAGPIASIALGLIFYLISRAGRQVWPVGLVGVLSYLSWINWVLAAFNLIPAFPLDGGRVLRSALWHFQGNLSRATRIATVIGEGFGILLMAFAIFQLFLGNLLGAFWYFLIGMFLRNASQTSYQQLMWRLALEGEPVRRFMHSDPVTVPPDLTLRDLVEDYIYRYHFKMYPVVADPEHHLAGCITTEEVKTIPREEWDRHTVQEVMQPCSPDNTVSPDTDAVKVLSKMSQTGLSRLLVTERDRLLAVISLKDLLNFLAVKLELEGRRHLLHPPRL